MSAAAGADRPEGELLKFPVFPRLPGLPGEMSISSRHRAREAETASAKGSKGGLPAIFSSARLNNPAISKRQAGVLQENGLTTARFPVKYNPLPYRGLHFQRFMPK
ncbi:MAG: hypothetical protein FWG74_05170, partial [Planctomycetes bacterium]|nr:hypothetical protein [Planctomycetota bacterium]